MLDNKTSNFLIPLPDASNNLSDDVLRLISALNSIDSLLNARPTASAVNTSISTAIANLVASAPSTLDTLNELATALGNDANFSTTVTNALAAKLALSGGTMTGVITFAAAQRVAASIVTGLAAVATSGAYTDLTGRPTLPSGAIVGTSDAQTLSSKTLSAPVITNYTETLYAPAAGSSFTVDLTNGTIQQFTTNANATITLPASAAGKSYTIEVAYGGAHTITWAGGGTIKWAGGVAPTATSTSGKTDVFNFFCDGTNTFGAIFGQAF